MSCPSCKSKNTINNPSLSLTVCTDCGYVWSECQLQNENTFSDNQLIGDATFKNWISNRIEMVNNSNNKWWRSLISKLNLPWYFFENAQRYYKCCINKSFVKGRSSWLCYSVIWYTWSRINKTQHWWIDFSDITKINLYKLGVCFIKFIKLFDLQVEWMDPSWLIRRFCYCLKLENKMGGVINTSLRIVQCMKKEWLCEGRHPSGICGAAIILSWKLNGIRSINITELSNIVKISEDTIIKRIKEFKETSYVKLTKEEFDNFNFDNISDEGTPPCFKVGKIGETEGQKTEDNTNSTIEWWSWTNTSSFNHRNNNQWNDDKPTDDTQIPNWLGKKREIQSRSNDKHNSSDELSDLSNDDFDEYISTKEEFKTKKALWEEKNKEWIEEQKEKNKYEMTTNMHKPQIKKNNIGFVKAQTIYSNPKDAILHNEKFWKMRMKKKMNFINNLITNKNLNLSL